MPCITLTTNLPITEEQRDKLYADIRGTMGIVNHKPEHLMVKLVPEAMISFGPGSCALFEVDKHGEITKEQALEMIAALTKIAGEVLGVNPKTTFVRFLLSPYWGIAGMDLPDLFKMMMAAAAAQK